MFINGTDDVTCIQLTKPFLVISNAILGGGLRVISSVINHTLKEYERPEAKDMPEFCRSVAMAYGCDPETSAVMLTAVPQKLRGLSRDGCCIITAGLGNAVALPSDMEWDERDGKYVYNPGTINCIVIVSDTLSPAALVEAHGITRLSIGEVVRVWGDTHRPGENLVGTPTDCLAVICPSDGAVMRFAGLGTKIGNEVARSVKEALGNALSHKYPNISLTLASNGVAK